MSILTCIMCVYNEKPFQVQRAVNSVLNQTFTDFDYIIVIDNPENVKAIELITEYAESDKRIKYFVNEKNMGLVYSRNLGIENSQSEFIAFFDSDDECLPNRFEVQLKFMIDNQDVDICSCGIQIFLEMNHYLSIPLISDINVETRIKRVNPINGNGFILRHSSIKKYGKFLPKYNRAEDYYLLISWFIKGAKIRSISEILLNYYIQDNYQQKSAKSLKQAISMKWLNRTAMKFSFGDYFYFLYDFFVLGLLYLLPPKLYFILFIFRNKK